MKKHTKYSLRNSKKSDLDLLFYISSCAMLEVNTLMNPEGLDMLEEYRKYSKNFNPKKILVIRYRDQDIGRLRLVRGEDNIYIGGIQILPRFQGKGIGRSIFNDLILEANRKGYEINLEVHHVNIRAYKFYKSLGFRTVKQDRKRKYMLYSFISTTQ